MSSVDSLDRFELVWGRVRAGVVRDSADVEAISVIVIIGPPTNEFTLSGLYWLTLLLSADRIVVS